jgi:hypothetical protein
MIDKCRLLSLTLVSSPGILVFRVYASVLYNGLG